MERPRLPSNETQRLKALHRSKLLDSPPERLFDAIVMRASEICKTPMAFLSLVDEHRQWFKSRVGLDATETDRDLAFCAHAILQEELMVVPDALSDDRFADNPLVTNEPNIRFYAGMPLVTSDGCALGTLCVVDRKPRELTADQIHQLKILAESTRILLEMRSSRLGEIFEKAVAATVEGVTIADAREPDMPIIFANEAFYAMTGYVESEVLGRNCRFLQGEGTDSPSLQKIRDSLTTRQNCVVELLNYTKAGRPFWNRLSLIPLSDEAGELTHVIGLQSDITEAKESEAARQRMLGMRATMHAVDDVVLNFMNSLQLYRLHMEETWNADGGTLLEFDSIVEETMSKLTKINAVTKFKSKTVARGITVLDTE
jgi:two-component system cell cycle sensor histidine kinase/response regulator CckA